MTIKDIENARSAGSFIGRPIWGYEITDGRGGLRALTPTAEGRAWVPRIFRWAIGGVAPTEIAQRLSAAGVCSGGPDGVWWPATIARMIRSRTYSGQRPAGAAPAPAVKPLVSPAVQDAAIARLASHTPVRISRAKLPKALLPGLTCGHPDCPGEGTWPMYRLFGKRDSKGNVLSASAPWYRCMGKGAQRKGCGAPMISVAELDARVLSMKGYRPEDAASPEARAYLARKAVRAWKNGSTINVTIDEAQNV